jgi:hypothetical protein
LIDSVVCLIVCSQCADGCTLTSPCCPLTSSTCSAQAQYIMSPVAQAGETIFSPCTVGNICESRSCLLFSLQRLTTAHMHAGSVMKGVQNNRVDTSCLVEPDATRTTISLQMCGNGIVEPGEECDPGQGTTSSCCDVDTCKFKNNAICDPDSTPCCTSQCAFAPATQICRPSRDSRCDQAEFCTGNSSSCPSDLISPNGASSSTEDLVLSMC